MSGYVIRSNSGMKFLSTEKETYGEETVHDTIEQANFVKKQFEKDFPDEQFQIETKLERGTSVDFEVFIEYPQCVSIGSIVQFQGSDIEIEKIDLVVPQEQSVLVRGEGKIS